MKQTKQKKRNIRVADCATWTVRIYLFLMLGVFPLYYQNKYYNMGDAKYLFFRRATLVMLAALAVILLCFGPESMLFSKKRTDRQHAWLKQFSSTDLAVLAYTGAAILSWLLSPFRSQTWIGSNEWYMGLLSQLLFAGIYFAVSRFGSAWKWLTGIAGVSGAAVCTIACLHRFQIDPLGFYKGLSDHYKILFLGTIGQATWYSSYLCVLLPVMMGVYLIQTNHGTFIRRLSHILTGGFLFLGFCSAVTQNSDSIYVGLGLAFVFLLWFTPEQPGLWTRYVELWLLALSAAKITGILQLQFPERVPNLDPLSLTITQGQGGWYVLAGVLCLFIVTRLTEPQIRRIPPSLFRTSIRRVRTAFYILLIICAAALPVLLWLNTSGKISIRTAFWQQTSYLIFDREWGNGRGRTWTYCAQIFAEYPPLMKLFGCGPDGLTFYSEAYHAEAIRAMWGDLHLTNAHNEWFTALIHYGIVGAAAYLSIFLTALIRILKNWKAQPALLALGAAITAYIGHNFFCYQQAVCTPLIFIVLGAAQSLIRTKESCK